MESGEREINIIDYENLSINNKHDKLIKKVLCLGVQTRNNPYFTIYNLRDSYHQRIKNARKDIEKIEKINLEYIEYFKNIDKLIVIKENKDGTLVFKKGIDEE